MVNTKRDREKETRAVNHFQKRILKAEAEREKQNSFYLK
jgi:hypothetical protein